jgi:hypothetical protein
MFVPYGERMYAIRPPMAIAGTARRPAAENRETVFVQRGKRGPLIPGPGASSGLQRDATGRKKGLAARRPDAS